MAIMQRFVTRFKHYLGMDLPIRGQELNFSLPKASGRFKASYSGSGDLLSALEECKDIPNVYFGLLLSEFKHINRCALKPRQRLALTYDICKLYYPLAQAQIAKHAQTGGVPEEGERKLVLIQLADIAQLLIVSCQILFATYYGGSNFRYARARSKVLECVAAIYELLILKQQARALRYQLLDEQDWQLANTLFYVTSGIEDVVQPLSTLQKILNLGGSRSFASLQGQFATLHIVAKFDMLRWPTQLQWVIASYLQSVEQAVQVRSDSGCSQLARNELIAYCYGAAPASPVLSQTPPGAALLFNCSGLTDAIRKDCMGLIAAKKNHDATALPPRFARFPEAEHFIISEQLVRGLQNSVDEVTAEQSTRVDDLRIFVSFSDVFSLLHHKQGLYGGEERLADVLAKRSALIAEDHIATEKSVWSLLFQNEKMIRLSTQETAFTTAMNIGSLVAYGVGEDINRPSLAVVSRIFRPSHKLVVIDMFCISQYAEAVIMSVNASESTMMGQLRGKPALLVYSKKSLNGWGLLFPPQDVLPGIDQVALRRNQQEFAITLQSRRNATNDFYLFSLTLPVEQRADDSEPDYAVPATRKTKSAGWLV